MSEGCQSLEHFTEVTEYKEFRAEYSWALYSKLAYC